MQNYVKETFPKMRDWGFLFLLSLEGFRWISIVKEKLGLMEPLNLLPSTVNCWPSYFLLAFSWNFSFLTFPPSIIKQKERGNPSWFSS